MKKLTSFILILLIVAISFAQGPPAPELQYYKTGVNPAFISVSGLDMDFVDNQDWLFTFTADLRCAGAYQVLGDPNFVPAFGKDQFDPGFEYREAIGIGLWDSQTDIFYKLTGNATGWNRSNAELIWMSLNLIKYEVTGLDGTVDLITDAGLTEVILTITGADSWGNDPYFFKVEDKNIESYIVTTSQSGSLEKVKRWVNDSWMNYKYSPNTNENSVTFTAIGTNKWTGEMVQAQKLVAFDSGTAPPNPGGDLYTSEYFKIILVGDDIYMEALSTVPVYVNFQVNGRATTKYLVSSAGTKPGDRKKVASTKGLSDFKINWAMYKGIDGLKAYQWTPKQTINQSISL